MRAHVSGSGLTTKLVLGLALAASLVACGGETPPEEDSDAPPAVEDNLVDVDVQEWAVIPGQTVAPAGEVVFTIQNVGEETNEFVVVGTDLDFRELPTAEDGSVDEEGEGIEPIDEVEDIASATTEELSVDLEAGSYVFFCNIVEEEDGETESHYQNGMSVAFEVQ